LFSAVGLNTPTRVNYYASRIPGLQFLKRRNPMIAYGHVIRHPQIGRFKSRFRSQELKRIDQRHYQDYAPVLNSPLYGQTEQFFAKYKYHNWFLYEFREHAQRRDRHYKWGRYNPNRQDQKKQLFIAYKENLILKNFYGHTLKASLHKWSPPTEQKILQIIDPHKLYTSKIADHLFTYFPESAVWGFLIISLLGLILWQWRLLKTKNFNK
jgi:hypothetical protein